jgi:hypothetical protein
MLALSGLCEGFARGWAYLHIPPILGPKPPSAKSRIPISSKLIENKRFQVLYFGHLRKTGGWGSYGHPTKDVHPEPAEGLFSDSPLSYWPTKMTPTNTPVKNSLHSFLRTQHLPLARPPQLQRRRVTRLLLSPLFPLHTDPSLVCLLFPLLTQKQGGTPPAKNVGAPTFLIFPLIFRTFLPPRVYNITEERRRGAGLKDQRYI